MGMSSFKEAFNSTNLEFFNGTGKYYDPIFEWFLSTGVTDLAFVPTDKLGKEYEGNLLVGDINSGYLYRFILNQTRTGLLLNDSLSDGVANNDIEKLEAALGKIKGGGITDMEIGPDGLVYVVSPDKIMRLEPIGTNVTLPLIVETTNVTETGTAGINGTATNATDTGGGATEATGATGDGDGGGGGGANTTGVSTLPGSSTLTDTAYQPNPVQVSVGDTVTWTNDDSTAHTVTSGQNGQPDGKFDSSIMAPQQTFEHTFTEGAGEYPYFCVLHPNMVGTVSVRS
jgi:plastocyanin